MIQVLSAHEGIVDAWRALRSETTSGFADLWLCGLLARSVDATIVESAEFRQLFTTVWVAEMEASLRALGYEPKVPREVRSGYFSPRRVPVFDLG